MATRVLVGFFIACTVAAALPVEKEASSNDILTETDYALFGNIEAYVYDDDGKPVKLTFKKNDNEESEESEDVTRRDLANRVFYFLYTSKNPIVPQPLYLDDEDVLKSSNFDPKKPTRFVTHGWMNSRNSPACTLSRDAYIQHGEYNVIVIDWSKISIGEYILATTRVKMVGEYISLMINFLEKNGMDLSQTKLSGHSLGAHVVGLAARHAKGTVNYVMGLDPALPGFALAGPGSRIAKGDADHVEIIHTNGGLLGFLTAIGDSDYYPNGGTKQLGCPILLDIVGACSHARSYEFYSESINSARGFHGKKCSSYIRYKLGLCDDGHNSIMGGHKRIFNASGSYYLETASKFPFALGKLFGKGKLF